MPVPEACPLALLAGGRGTRLGAATAQTPKSLVEVAGRPFIDHQLELLRAAGIKEIVVCTGHLGAAIETHLGDGSAWAIRVRYSYDGTKLLGTAGALRQALPLLGREFLVLYGDSYLETDYLEPWRKLRATPNAMAVMTIYRNRGLWDTSNIAATEERILRYDKRQPTPDMEYIDYGLASLRAEALAGAEADLAEVYSHWVGRHRAGACEVQRRFYEIGTPAGRAETEAHILSKAVRK